MYCVVINVLAQTNGQTCSSSDYFVETVTSAVLDQLKEESLDEYQRSRASNASHKREWYYGSVHAIYNV